MKTFIFLLLLFTPIVCTAQFHDYNTVLGFYGGGITPPGDVFGISHLTFPEGKLHVEENFELRMFFDACNAALSDSSGNLLLYTNGVDIGNAAWDTLQDGWALNNDGPGRSRWPQFAVCLPKPGDPSRVMVFYGDYEIFQKTVSSPIWYTSLNLYAAEVDMDLDNGLGGVVARDIKVIEDTLSNGKFTACKHANGRDWWILTQKINSNRIYRVLLDPGGLHSYGAQTIDTAFETGLGQACFSPDGSKYFTLEGLDLDTVSPKTNIVNIFDFDRCTGLLSNQKQLFDQFGGFGGMAISPNSRYLYLSQSDRAYQYDLWAADIAASKTLVMVYDGFEDTWPTYSFFLQRMPDDKLYACTIKQSKYLHVIHYPDEPGAACQFEQHGIQLPTRNSNSVPNFPYFRLGPLDGSPCDTLGLDNHPRAFYRYEQDTLNPLLVEFRDLSYYEPATWRWDFGDGSPVSAQRHPWHTFPGPNVYDVCLTVSNANGTDTHCKKLYLGVSAQDNPVLQSQITVSPNPFADRLSVALKASLRNPVFRLSDAAGRLVLEERLVLGINELETVGLPAGLYFWRVEANGEVVKAGKVVAVE
ncbi:MAG: PKD domain-containing protein [Saprospiraceae bacterium]|nr:PKD domain-containing protein [Saprospiraceae bacterium]